MSLLQYLLLFFFLSTSYGSLLQNFHQIPIPKSRFGYTYKNGSIAAPVQIDMYMCLQCGDAKVSFPVIKEVADHYGPNMVRLVFHGFPLPYLKGSWLAAQAARTVDQLKHSKTADYIQSVFDNQDRLLRSPRNVSDADMIEVLAELAEGQGVAATDFLERYNDANDTYGISSLCRHEWKMTITHGVYGSPWFFINDMSIIDFSVSWTKEDWISIIDPVLVGYEEAGEVPTCHPGDPGCVLYGKPCTSGATQRGQMSGVFAMFAGIMHILYACKYGLRHYVTV